MDNVASLSWDEAPLAAPSKIPNAWRAMEVLAEAVAVLEANPDLIGDDILLALESEASEAVRMIDAIVLAVKDKERIAAGRRLIAGGIVALAKRDEDAADRLRTMAGDVMDRLRLKNYQSLSGPVFPVWRPGKVVITDEAAVPDEFKTTVSVTTVDKRAIAKALNAKQPVPGAMLSNGYQSVTIKG